MTYCVKCSTTIEEGVKFCPVCGEAVGNQPGASPENVQQNSENPPENYENSFAGKISQLNDTKDDTASFDAADIEKNKFMAVLAYIIFLIPLLAAKDSPFAKFHANQGLVLFLGIILSSIVAVIPIIGWMIAPIAGLIITVLSVIGIINALNGNAKELPIIGKFKILK